MRTLVTNDNMAEVVKYLCSLKEAVIAFDTETTGLKWQDPMFSLQLAVKHGNSYYFNFNTYHEQDRAIGREVLTQLQPLWINPHVRWIAANAKFDMRRLEIDGITLAGEIYDVLLMARILYNKHMSYSLDNCLKRIGKSKNDKVSLYIKDHKLYTSYNVEGKKTKEKDLHYDRVPLDIMYEYGMDDAEGTLELYEYQTTQFTKEDNKGMIDLVHSNIELVKTVYAMESKGICIDVDACKSLKESCTQKELLITLEIENIVGKKYEAGPIWLSQALQEQGIKIDLTEKGNPELDYDSLESMDNALASLIMMLRETEKEAAFYSTLLRYQVDGVIHTNYRLNGTDTGRFSCSEPNVQQIPDNVRSVFKPRKDYLFFAMDYDQMEYRIMADYAGEMGMIEAIKGGLDPHTYVANMMGVDRKLAKTLNFGLLYGMGIGKLADALNTDISKAKTLKSKYYMELPKVSQLTTDIMRVSESRGFIRNKYGRVYQLDNPQFSYKMPNYLIQGTGADVVRTAMNKIAFYLDGTKSHLLLQVHDELVFEIHKDELHLVPEIKRMMEDEYAPMNGMNLTCGCEYSEESWNSKTFKPWS